MVYILYVSGDNAPKYNEDMRIYVPSAPLNLSTTLVTSQEVHLLWVPPTGTILKTLMQSDSPNEGAQDIKTDVPIAPITPLTKDSEQSDAPQDYKIYQSSLRDWYNSDKHEKYSEILTDKYKRDVHSNHRHRKRRQDLGNPLKPEVTKETHQSFEVPDIVKRSFTEMPPLNTSRLAYVLYYEQGVFRSDAPSVQQPMQSEAIKKICVFASDLRTTDYTKGTKNLTLLNKAGQLANVVGFTLTNLRSFTPYKVWVRACFIDDVRAPNFIEKLGPESEPLYLLTDVRSPSAPVILNFTCNQFDGILYLQWRQPMLYDNSIDQYVVSLRKLPQPKPHAKYTMPTSKNDIETTISVNADLSNNTSYEVKIYAVTLSVTKKHSLINGTESPPEEVSSLWCSTAEAVSSDARAPDLSDGQGSTLALIAVIPISLLAMLGVAFIYWRCRSRLSKCISAAYSYLEEGGERAVRAPLNTYKKPVNCSPLRACSGSDSAAEAASDVTQMDSSWRKPPRMSSIHHPAVQSTVFPQHVTSLHADGDIGFSKEYEIVVTRSAALGHTSHHSHRPENRLKNRYLNITAYDHSRVCVSAGYKCEAAGCLGEGRGVNCDYVNANFIDGILPVLDEERKKYIRQKLEKRQRPPRQPSIKPVNKVPPPPNLSEGIESAFLNIEFSGIVESEEQEQETDCDSDQSDDDELDDVYVDLDGVQTRVKLEWLLWKRRYIATQGPTPATLDAFWRMIWQHRVHTIVMITNLVERGRRKCDMYWPSGGRGSSAEFGGVHVTLLHEDVRQAYTVRHMRVKKQEKNESGAVNCESETRPLLQYHYTVWPDHGTPRHPLQVLPFVQAASSDPNTVLVHCSAGVGRTGTYIVLDAQLNQLNLTGTLSPLGFLCRARTQRNHLVQTEEQYVFVHDALLEHVRSGNTAVEFKNTREYLVKLLEPISEEELQVLDFIKASNELTNGFDGESSSLQSQGKDESTSVVSEKTVYELPNGDGLSVKTDEFSERSKSASVKENGDVSEEKVNGEESEGVYDLAPRSTDTYSKKMAAYANLTDQEKEEIRRVNRVENYALLERMRSLANKNQQYQGPPPVNLLEKQYLLITRSCVEPGVCPRATHNVEKNRRGGILPSDSARVMLIPKPGVEGSDYVNASWVSGRRRLREFAVAQHPISGSSGSGGELWRMLWDHTAQLVLLLTNADDTECETFWPTENETELYVANFKASFVSKDTFVAYRKTDRLSPVFTPKEQPEINGLRRQENPECNDDERLIPANQSPVADSEPTYRFDRTELRLERLSGGNRDLSARKSIANGDLFSSLSENRRSGPKSPRSPSKMSLKNFRLSSPTRFKFPDWGSKGAGSPPEVPPPPPPVAPPLSVEDEVELRRPCYGFEKVQAVPEDVKSDRIIEVTNVSVHSLQDDYQLSVKFIRCNGWLDGDTVEYNPGRPDDNPYIKAIKEAGTEEEREQAVNRLTEPFKDSFALIEYIAGCQMEYKNGPVVVVDKYGGWRSMSFCTLAAACGGARNPAIADPAANFHPKADSTADIYCWAALSAHARCPTDQTVATPYSHKALLANYAALARYGPHTPR